MKPVARTLHRRLAPWLLLPLVVAALTGLTYRIGRTWFGFSRDTGDAVLAVHTGAWMGDFGEHLQIALNGLGLLALALGGAVLLRTGRARGGARGGHRVAAWVLLAPLLVTATTGLGYHFGNAWFDLAPGTLKLLLNLHQGSWLGPTWRPFYVILVGVGLLFLLGSGAAMLRKKTAPVAKT
ncbi:MAG: hypothetical protein MUE42_11055 [Opitutaceae bacterium]|jgi:hypothetical protein|nr:hypothetical protein [Opitutaceae bacterium]